MSRYLLLLLSLYPGLLLAAMDPTQPPQLRAVPAEQAQAGQPAAGLVLQAILRGPGGAWAVIDGQRLRNGQVAGELQVLAIHGRFVDVQYRGQRQRLTLSQPILVPRR